MTRLPDIQLDDRRFQDLVSEARLRINRSCPEWTEHNVSDPGVTLIELFAWMTEMTIYRLNRVPDKLHVTLLELLGIQLDGPSAAATDVRFRLVEPPERAAAHPGRRDRGRHAAHRARRVGRLPGRARTSRSRWPSRPPTCSSAAARSRTSGSPTARRARRAPTSSPFGTPPAVGDALYLGFDDPLAPPDDAGRRRRLARARRRRQPRGPAAALGGLAGRQPVDRGDRARGPHRRLQLRRRRGRAPAARRARRSSRSAGTACTGCAAASTTRRATAARRRPTRRRRRSTRSPPRRSARCCPTSHAAQHRERDRSASPTARPARRFPLRFAPVLKPATGETLEVQDPESGDWAAWELRPDFVVSTAFDRHYTLNPVGGRDRVRPGDPRDRRRLDPVRRDPAQGRRAALHAATATAAAATATSRPARSRCCARRSPASTRSPTPAPPTAASTRRRSSTRASARRWRSARATAP